MSVSAFKVRHADPISDYTDAGRVIADVYSADDATRALLEFHRGELFVGELNGEVIACACIAESFMSWGLREIAWVVVTKKYQRQGFGSALIQELQRNAAVGPLSGLLLISESQAFYERFGFKTLAVYEEKSLDSHTSLMFWTPNAFS